MNSACRRPTRFGRAPGATAVPGILFPAIAAGSGTAGKGEAAEGRLITRPTRRAGKKAVGDRHVLQRISWAVEIK